MCCGKPVPCHGILLLVVLIRAVPKNAPKRVLATNLRGPPPLNPSCTALTTDPLSHFEPYTLHLNTLHPRSPEAGSWLPNGEGQLLSPSHLYDPRNPDLAALLPPACFPAPCFCHDMLALNMLAAQLGLRAQATHETLLQVRAGFVVGGIVGGWVGGGPCCGRWWEVVASLLT